MKAKELGIRMTIRLEGLSPAKLAMLHKATDGTKTKTLGCGSLVTERGDGINFVEVTRADLKGGLGYTVILTVNPALEGNIFSESGRRYAEVYPSRRGLDEIFEAIGILPEEEKVVDTPDPALAYQRRT